MPMPHSLIAAHLQKHGRTLPDVDSGLLAFLANLENVGRVAPPVAGAMVQELTNQRNNIKLIASENYAPPPTQSAMANLLTDNYAESFPEHRFYAGCGNVDRIE